VSIAITNATTEMSSMVLMNATAATSDMLAMAWKTDPLREEEGSAIFFVISWGAVQYPARSSDAA
jgi:hypothetical protein